jgi:hypothetical protein
MDASSVVLMGVLVHLHSVLFLDFQITDRTCPVVVVIDDAKFLAPTAFAVPTTHLAISL